MKKVYFYDCGGLYFCGKVRKDYQLNDIFKLKSMICKLKVTKIINNELWVKIA